VDISFVSLVLANLITIYAAVTENWDFSTVFGAYFFQSLIIGVFSLLKILDLKNFSTTGYMIGGHAVEPNEGTKRETAFWFVFVYGFFHACYAFVIFQGGFAWLPSTVPVIAVFFVNHLISYLLNKKQDSERRQNIGRAMFFPLARIIPMHLAIASGAFLAPNLGALTFFMALKMGMDLVMHEAEHLQDEVDTQEKPSVQPAA